jgi:two-component system, OmpR family, phosphate regulon response regulator PhoB
LSLITPRLLIIEDEPSQIELLRYNFARQGFEVRVATDGEEGLQAATEDPPDLILLDWMLPELPGIEVCRQLRRNKVKREIPVIMLTARSEKKDKIRGLDGGADDYVTKPYSVKELIARARAALRRPAASVTENMLSVGTVQANLEKHTVHCNGVPVQTSPTEFRLLVTLMQSPDRVFFPRTVAGYGLGHQRRPGDAHCGRSHRSPETRAGAGRRSGADPHNTRIWLCHGDWLTVWRIKTSAQIISRRPQFLGGSRQGQAEFPGVLVLTSGTGGLV